MRSPAILRHRLRHELAKGPLSADELAERIGAAPDRVQFVLERLARTRGDVRPERPGSRRWALV